MKNFNQHILHQINMEVNTDSESEAFDLKTELDGFMKGDFLPQLELLLDEVIPDNQIIRYDSVNLEINLSSNESLQLVKILLMDQLRAKLNFSDAEFSVHLPEPGIIENFGNVTKKKNTRKWFSKIWEQCQTTFNG